MKDTNRDSLDPVRRLHVLAAALPGSVVVERTLTPTFDQVWRVVSDVETMAPRYERNVEAVEVVERTSAGDRIIATLRGGLHDEMDVRIVPGWCLMQSQSFVIAFGARPTGSHTLLAHLEYRRTAGASIPTEQQLQRAYDALARELDTIESIATDLP